jgi:hypothetical protein
VLPCSGQVELIRSLHSVLLCLGCGGVGDGLSCLLSCGILLLLLNHSSMVLLLLL